MTEESVALGFLFARLVHPDGMVRERSCSVIARLLNSSDTAELARERLESWMQSQRLESTAIFALLIWIRAKIENPRVDLPSPQSIVNCYPRHSLVSWLLLQELYGRDSPEPEWRRTFSEGLWKDFEPEPFFLRHTTHFVPPVYDETAKHIVQETGAPFINQWAWEWNRLVDELSVVPDEHVLESRGDEDSNLHACYDFRLSEIYRSAYLRTLSWAMYNRIIDQNDALKHAARCCPIDVGLWQVAPGRCPDWWPTVLDPGDTENETVDQVLSGLKGLFYEQTHSRDGWLLAQISGLIQGKNVHIELKIYGFFQRCLGPREPDFVKLLLDFSRNVAEPLTFDSRIRFSGHLIPRPGSAYVERRADWEIIPSFIRVESPVVSGWQWWRYYRRMWVPGLCLFDGSLDITVTDREISYAHNGSLVGRWIDWSGALLYTMDANLPPATGQALYVRKEHLEAFSDVNKYSFCWLWGMTRYHRHGNWGKYETSSFVGILGATRI